MNEYFEIPGPFDNLFLCRVCALYVTIWEFSELNLNLRYYNNKKTVNVTPSYLRQIISEIEGVASDA